MRDTGRRPIGRLFYWALILMIAAFWVQPAAAVPQSGAATTTIADIVYMADGTPATGTLIITWPAFVTAGGTAIAAGDTSVTLGAKGSLNVALVPNAGASPAGVYYTVVFQLGAGQVKTEYWVVPTNSPVNLAAVRATPGAGVATQPVSIQYVNSELATKADDNAVVHLNGQETISGVKTFASAPNVPAPTGGGQVANKSYVDQSVATVGAGNYLSTAGGTMTGPITLPGNPSAPLQATPKQYVDLAFGGKADLIAGLVPANELGSGSANAATCLLGNGTWGACGSGGGSGNVSTTPATSQNVVQPVGTQFSTNNLANARYVTASWNWVQSPTDNLSIAGSNTIHLSPCPLGLDTSNNPNAQYAVYIAGTGTPEAAPVTGGSCAPGSANGTITVTTAYPHAAGYTAGSASSGIQEAINDSGTQHGTIVLLPAASSTPNYLVYSPVFLNARKTLLSGYGAVLQCFTRTACLIDGNYAGSTGAFNTIAGLEFVPGLNVDGAQIATVSASNGTFTVTTATNHPFVTGDYLILFYSNSNMTQEGRFKITVTGANQFTYNVGNSTFAAIPSYGWAAIENTAIEDIADHVTLRDIKFGTGSSQYFHWGIVIGNDQSFKLDGMSNEGSGSLIRCTANFCGALVYGRGDQGAAPVINIDHLEASMQCGGNGVRVAAGNTLHVMNSVVQGFSQYGIYYAGGLQDLMVGGTYQESSSTCYNPAYPGSMASAAGILTNSDLTFEGSDPIGGYLPNFTAANPGPQQNNYFVVMHSSTKGVLGMFYIGDCLTTGAGNCTTYWPEPNLDGLGTVTYDELRTTGLNAIPPNGTGSYAIATGISGNCSTAGICSNVDSQTGASSYTVLSPVSTVRMNFWPGTIILGGGARLHINDCGQAGGIVTTTYLPAIYCNHSIPGPAGTYTPYWASSREGDSSGNNNASVGAELKQAGPATGAATSGVTGLYGFLNTGSLGQTDMLTFAYSNPFLTLATPGYRPSAAAADTAIGFDSAGGSMPSAAQLAFRAPVAISEYIGSVFDNGSYKERLTASGKTFNVPVTINGNLTVTGTCNGCGGGTGGSMTWPSSAGIAVYGGSSAWGTSLAAPGSAIVGVSDAQTLTNKTIDGVSPTTLGYLDVTSSVQTQLNGKAPSVSPTFTGIVSVPVTGSMQCLHVNASGVISGTGSDCGSSGGAGSGVVNSGMSSQLAMYSTTGTAVSGDALLADNGATLNYTGSGGISASSGTFSGNLTVGGQLMLTGPWQITTPPASLAMSNAPSGTSSMGISNDGNFYISTNAGSPSKILTVASDAVPSVFGRSGPITAQAGDYTVSQITGAAPSASPTFTGMVTEPVPTLPSQAANSFFAAPSGSAGAPSFRAITAADIPVLNQSTTGTATGLSVASALPNGTTATTQSPGDSSTKVATTAFATANFAAMSVTNSVGDIPKISGNNPTPSLIDSGVLSGPYAIPWITAVRGGTGATFAQNVVKMWGVVLTFPLSTTYLAYNVVAADNSAANYYDVGIANASGAIVVDLGATAGTSFSPSTGPHTLSWAQGTKTLQPGKYYVVITTNCASSCATISADNSTLGVAFQNGATAGTTTGGALTSFTPPSDVWTWGASVPALVVK